MKDLFLETWTFFLVVLLSFLCLVANFFHLIKRAWGRLKSLDQEDL